LISRTLRSAIYREHLRALEKGERTRAWSVFTDVDWSLAATTPRDEELALCAETFLGVEMFLPDYLAHGIETWRERFGQLLFTASWGAEEAKHSIVLRELLLRTGQRSEDQLLDFESTLLARRWTPPFDSPRAAVLYGLLQEQTTFVNYTKHATFAHERGAPLLASIYRLIARDEVAHARFHEAVAALLLAEDRAGTLADLAAVLRSFRMPARDLLPDADRRHVVFVKAGIDRVTFVRDIWLPVLKRLGIDRHELPRSDAISAGDGRA
jgi:acyl-[acyl-carrier-protein] desaturase